MSVQLKSELLFIRVFFNDLIFFYFFLFFNIDVALSCFLLSGLNAFELYCQCFVFSCVAPVCFPPHCLVLCPLSAVSPSWCRIRIRVCNLPAQGRESFIKARLFK